MIDDLLNLDPTSYEQPKAGRGFFDKLDRIKKITAEIEQNAPEFPVDDDYAENLKIDYRNELNLSQFAAVTTLNGPILVIAGAGSGKTRTIIYRVAYMLEKGVAPEHILLLTFTRKAAGEMLSRAANLLADNRAQKITGGTFHSFSNNMLRRYGKLLGIASNFTIIDTGDAADIMGTIRRSLALKKRKRAFPRKSKVQTIISKARNCELPIAEVVSREYDELIEFVPDIINIAKGYKDYKRENNVLDFDDLMGELRIKLKENDEFRSRLQSRYRYIMVDEYQDTNTAQKDIVDLLAEKHRNVMVVGDDSQSIYSFRGANFENILSFPETYPDCKFIKIEQNYRSSTEILSFTNSVIEKATFGYKKKLFAVKSHHQRPTVHQFFTQEEEAKFIKDEIENLTSKGVSRKEIAVLYRASFHGNFIQAELLKANIPYVVYGGIKFVERRHVKDILAYLRILLNFGDAVAWVRVLNLLEGVGKVSAAKIFQHAKTVGGTDFSKFKNRKYGGHLQELGKMLSRAADESLSIEAKIELIKDYYTPLLMEAESDYENRLMDIDVLANLAERYNSLEQFLSDFALDPPSDKFKNSTVPATGSIEGNPVTLSTVHSAKGLEWDTVFVPHLLDGMFPSSRAMRDIEQLDEERRLFYVACTRAKQRLYLTLPSYVSSWESFMTLPSRFLAEVAKSTYNLVR